MERSKIRWFSSTRQAMWQEKTAGSGAQAAEAGNPNLTITGETFQTVEGFGGCFNELGYVALNRLSEAQRNRVLDALFAPDGELKLQMCRLPIGASDYALEWYSLNETDGDLAMAHFSIERDRKYLIPYIREALKRNPGLKLFASPWSPPTWMKHPRAYNYGTLRWEPEILEAYALYFVKFVQAYREEGITIHQIHVQNEVAADQKFPSCVWTGEQLRDFIRDYLGPAFERHGLETEIWLGTINAPDMWDIYTKKLSTDFDDYAHTVLSDPGAYQYIKGVGYQWAGKNAIQRTAASYPELRYMQTENECGDGNNTWEYARYVFNLFQHYFFNGVSSYVYWNMVLEPKGRSTWGWEQNAMITADPETAQPVFNPEYYVMKHYSHFVSPESVRLGLKGMWTGNASAFAAPNGDRVVVISNPFKDARTLRLSDGAHVHVFEMEPESFNTIVLPG